MPVLADGGGGGLPYPPGDPDGVRSAASRLTSASHEFSSIAGDVKSEASSLLGSWQGAAASAFSTASTATNNGLSGIYPVHSQAASALTKYASALQEAQQLATKAQQLLDSAQTDFTNACNTASTLAQTASDDSGKQATTDAKQAAKQQTDAQNNFSAASAQAQRMADSAMTDAQQAADTAARMLNDLQHELTTLTRDKVADVLGAPGFALTVKGLPDTMDGVKDLSKLADMFSALKDGDFDKVVDLDKDGFEDAAKVAEEYGENSPEAIKAWLQFESGVIPKTAAEAADSLGGISKVADADQAADGLTPELTMLSKLGLGAAVVGDVATLADWDGKWDDGTTGKLDDLSSAGNLAGVGAYAAGTEMGGAALELVGVNAVADWIPGVGEVVMGATALYLAGSFVAENWSSVEAAGKDVYNAVAWVDGKEVQGLEDAANFAGNVTVGLGHVAMAGIDEAGSVVNSGVSTAEHFGSEALNEAGSLASSAGSVASGAAHDLNPMNW